MEIDHDDKHFLDFSKHVFSVEDDCNECDEVLEGLESIDDETDALDITFVKVKGGIKMNASRF